MSDREPLPGLESVEAGGYFSGMILLLLAVAAFAAYLIYDAISSHAVQSSTPYLLLAAFVVIAVLLKLFNNPSYDFNWETTSEGLRFSGFFRGGFIRWDAVTEVNHQEGKRIIIISRDNVTHVPLFRLDFNASIWQHLNQIGKADAIKLSKNAESLWTPIPDDVPHEMSWTNPHPPKLWIKLIPPVIILGCLALMIASGGLSTRHWFIVLLPMSWFLNWFGKEYRVRPVISMIVNSHDFTAQTVFGTLNLPWEAVRFASCTCEKLTLEIPGASLVIPRRDNDDLILCIIRRLRKLEEPLLVTLPESYVATWQYGSAEV